MRIKLSDLDNDHIKCIDPARSHHDVIQHRLASTDNKGSQ